jgi:3,4-dihydroxy 2-butanone 4-phosphate synthase/GTP cyclohydrolase II
MSAVVRPAHTDAVRFEVETLMPTHRGRLRVRAYTDLTTGADHLAVVADPVDAAPLVRLHSECLTGEVLGSAKCDCGPQLEAALDAVARAGGVVIYLRGHEGRGIGLVNKLRAYRLQESGLDTVDANTALGLPVDDRDYRPAAAILTDLGVQRVRLMTNNPDKLRQLRDHGVEVVERVPVVIRNGAHSDRYLETKRVRMGHLLP